MNGQAWSGPQGYMIPQVESASGPKMVVYDTTGDLYTGTGTTSGKITVGDVFLLNAVGGAGALLTPTGGTAYTQTGERMSQMVGDGAQRLVLQKVPAAVGIANNGQTLVMAQFATAFVTLAAAGSKIKPRHGMEILANLATTAQGTYDRVSTLEPAPGATSARLAGIGDLIRATPGRGIVLAKVKLVGVTTLASGTPLVVSGANPGCLTAALVTMAGTRVVGRLAATITNATSGAIVLALVDFDGDNGFGMIQQDAV